MISTKAIQEVAWEVVPDLAEVVNGFGPGGSLLTAGAAIGVVGLVLLSRFLRANPRLETT